MFSYFLEKEKKSCMVRVQGLILSDIIRVHKGLIFMSKESFSLSLKAHSSFRERKTLSLVKFEARSLTAILSGSL